MTDAELLALFKAQRVAKRRAQVSTSLLREEEKSIAGKQNIMEIGKMESVGVTPGQLVGSNPSEASSSSPILPTVDAEEKSMCKGVESAVTESATSVPPWKPTLSSEIICPFNQ